MQELKLLHPEKESNIEHLDEVVGMIRDAIRDKEHITVVEDYDADGICGSAILYKTLTALGSTPTVRLLRRFTEGYGFSFSMLNEIKEGLLITVDNGIAAVDEIAEAKRMGNIRLVH